MFKLLLGNPKYEDAVSRVSELIHGLDKNDGLVPIFINANSGQFRQYSTITMGARHGVEDIKFYYYFYIKILTD